MNVASSAVRSLERHFVGALSVPSRLWLDAVPLSHVVMAGSDALRYDGTACVIDFGAVESPGSERQVVRITTVAGGAAEMRLSAIPPWLDVHWIQATGDTVCGSTADIELVASHDVLRQTEFSGAVRIAVGGGSGNDECEELLVRMTARRTHPLGAFDFDGSPQPRGFDFGVVDPLVACPASYGLAFDNLTSIPLTVRFADLPAWLTFEIDGHPRVGPMPGRFFERAAPFAVKIRPNATTALVGSHHGTLRVESDDPRPAFRSLHLRFSVELAPSGPFVRALPDPVRAATARPLTTAISVENWGRTPARLVATNVRPSLKVLGTVTVPAARHGRPGVASVPIRLFPARLPAGAKSVPVVFNVEGSNPLQVVLPVQVPAADRNAAGKHAVAPAAMAALFALLAFSVLIVLYLRML